MLQTCSLLKAARPYRVHMLYTMALDTGRFKLFQSDEAAKKNTC